MKRQDHLLVILAEECAEVTQEVAKSLRFGLDDFHPKYPEADNRGRLNTEINQIEAMIAMLRAEGVIPFRSSAVQMAKVENVEKYLEYSKKVGRLDEN